MKRFEHGADLEKIKNKYSIKNIIDFSSNVNIFQSSKTNDILNNINVDNLSVYPDINYTNLRKKLASKYNTNLENVIVGNGSTEIIFLLTKLDFISDIGILSPTFSEYTRSAIINKKNIHNFYYEDDFSINLEKINFDKIQMLFICNPNNPSGNTNNLLEVLKKCNENNIILVVDETFMDFNTSENSLLEYINDYNNLFIIKAVTKFHALTGVRLGYGFSSKEVISKLWEIKEPWTINHFAEKFVDVIFDTDFEIKSREFYKNETNFLYEELNKIEGLVAFPSESNFILIKLPNQIDSSSIKENLIINSGILIRDCSNYEGLNNNYIRVNVKDRENNLLLLEAIKKELLCLKK